MIWLAILGVFFIVIVIAFITNRDNVERAAYVTMGAGIICAVCVGLVFSIAVPFVYDKTDSAPERYTREVEANLISIEDDGIIVLEKGELEPHTIKWHFVYEIGVWDDEMLEMAQDVGGKMLFTSFVMDSDWEKMTEYWKVSEDVGGNLDYLPAVTIRYGIGGNELLWKLLFFDKAEMCEIDYVPASYMEASLQDVSGDARTIIEDKIAAWGSGDGSGRYGWLYSPTSVEQEREQAEELLEHQKEALAGLAEVVGQE